MADMKKFLDELYKDPKNESAFVEDIQRIETPSPSLNWALSGGIVPGRFYVLTGPEGSGKSMFTVSLVHSIQKHDPEAISVWFDTERSFTSHWINVFFKSPDMELAEHVMVRRTQKPADIFDYFADKMMDMIDRGCRFNACVIDSVQQMIGPKEENKTSTDKAVMGDLAAYLPGALRKISEPSRQHQIPWFFIAQVRDNFDNAGNKYVLKEDKYTLTGGMAFKHAIDVIILLEGAKGKKNAIFDPTIKNMDDKEMKIGHLIRAMITKNRLGPTYRKAEFFFEYENGIVGANTEIAKLALNQNLVSLDGRKYMLNERSLGTGKDQFIESLDDPKIKEELMTEIHKLYRPEGGLENAEEKESSVEEKEIVTEGEGE